MQNPIQIIGLIVACSLLGSAASSANISSKPYQASYQETSSVGGKAVRTYATDGKGHGRSEITRDSGRKDVSLLDLPNHRITILRGDSKTAISMPLRDNDVGMLAQFGSEMRAGGKPLGSKVIDGHPCHGRHYDLGETSEDLWTGDDIGVRVFSKVQSKFGTTESHLRSFSTQAPDPKVFAIPADYNQVPMSGGQGL
jgi:hypothetical protein